MDWARAYGLIRDPGSDPHAVCLIGPGPGYAMTTDLDDPVIIATVTTTTAGGEPAGPLLIDGYALPVTVRKCDTADAQGVRWRVRVAGSRRRGAKLHQLEPSVAVQGLQHRDVHADALESHDAVHPITVDRPLAEQLESELDEERRRGREVVDHDAHVLHALDGHALLLRCGATIVAPSHRGLRRSRILDIGPRRNSPASCVRSSSRCRDNRSPRNPGRFRWHWCREPTGPTVTSGCARPGPAGIAVAGRR